MHSQHSPQIEFPEIKLRSCNRDVYCIHFVPSRSARRVELRFPNRPGLEIVRAQDGDAVEAEEVVAVDDVRVVLEVDQRFGLVAETPHAGHR